MSKKTLKKLDMRWGNAAFLKPYWNKRTLKVPTSKSLNYEFGGQKSLKKAILKLHEKIGNADTENKHVVIGNGATQIILGLMDVLRKRLNKRVISANPPHFSRFPVLADMLHLGWRNKNVDSVHINTSPNNPDNAWQTLECDILDLSYNWPQYTSVIKRHHPAMVFSLSKATGHASTRIGWVLLDDKDIAHELEQFIEFNTAGVSIESQLMAEAVIKSQLKCSIDESVFKFGREVLDKRWDAIDRRSFKFNIQNYFGMFLWAKGKAPKEVEFVPGKDMGSTKEFFRLNVGCDEATFKKFLKLGKIIK